MCCCHSRILVARFFRSSFRMDALCFFLAAKAWSSFSFKLRVFFVTFLSCLFPVFVLGAVAFAMPHAPYMKQGEEVSTCTVLHGTHG